MQILPAGSDPAYPERSESNEGVEADPAHAMITDSEIAFRDIIAITEVPLFFVFSEDAWGTPIRHAQYTHRVEDADNRELGDVPRVNVSFDELTHRWFIPIKDLFGERLYDVDPRDEQLLTLDLVLSDSSRITILVRFRASGPLPKIVSERTNTKASVSPEAFVKTASRSGLVVFREAIENPTSRAFSLWVGGKGEDLRLETLLSVPRWTAMPMGPPQGPFYEKASSTGALRIDEIRAIDDDGDELFSLSPGKLTEIPLRPSGELELEWIAHPAPGTPLCALPPGKLHDVSWYRYPFCRGDMPCAPERHARVVSEQWGISGARLTGRWVRAMALSNTYDEAAGTDGARDGLEVSVDEKTGERAEEGIQMAGCQGVY